MAEGFSAKDREKKGEIFTNLLADLLIGLLRCPDKTFQYPKCVTFERSGALLEHWNLSCIKKQPNFDLKCLEEKKLRVFDSNKRPMD